MLYSIRPVRPQDAPDINAIRSMRGTMENVLGMPSNRDEQAERFLTSLGSDDHYFVAAAMLEDGTEQVIGSVNLHVGKRTYAPLRRNRADGASRLPGPRHWSGAA